MSNVDEPRDAFWAWVKTQLCPRWPRVAGAVDQALVAELGREVDLLGAFDFEIGPIGDDFYLALSPRGDAERYAQTKAIVARAPTVDGWVFLADGRGVAPGAEMTEPTANVAR